MSRGGGINSLLGDSDLELRSKVAAFGGVEELNINLIDVGKQQPRSIFEESLITELADSIKQHGLIQPITVRTKVGGRFEIISGERRYRATKELGLNIIPAYVRHVDDQQSLELAIIENIQRENLNPIELALSFNRMIEECQLSQEALAQRVGKSRSAVTNFLRLLNLPSEIQSGLIIGAISMGQARPLIPLTDANRQLEIYHIILENGLSSREIEALVKSPNHFEAKADPLEMHKEDMRIEEISLKGKTKVPIGIQVSDFNKGSVSIKFKSTEELERILSLLG